ncbi:hypothetical protein K450DRAFT_267484 [Umbelopsis ramanniana AG]|uniref:Secreted protein n=1 Tax=Umbelopsis ramanniana AG TaxID=1314678 RepID=A0AAD5EID9_UMBRA|nr:uncharacterized protein K450DRAFT_267484 [Umbelopsis ramanniana AG]KAI8584109.1 hypothetical protein K450DRAFT_267484 [Umbelopsis ramanniana AG]
MKVHFFVLAVIASAASNTQAATCNKLHSLERQAHPTCHHQITAMVPKTCSVVNNSNPKKALKSFNLEALATKRCPAVPLRTKKSECRSIRGTSLIDPQCPHAESTTLQTERLTKSLSVRTLERNRCPVVSMEKENREYRSLRGTSRIDAQWSYPEPTVPASNKLTKPWQADSPVPRTSNSEKDIGKFKLPLSSPRGNLLALEPSERFTCPNGKKLKAAFNENSNGKVKKATNSVCKAHIQPVFPVKA